MIVHSGGGDDRYLEFIEKAELFGENMVHISDDSGAIANRYGVDAYPTTLLIDADLRISSIIGVMDSESQTQAVQAVRPDPQV